VIVEKVEKEGTFKVEITEIYDPVKQRVIKKVEKRGDEKGNITNLVTLIDDKGQETKVEERVKPGQQVAKVKENKSNQVSQSLLNSNPYSAVLKANSVETPAETQEKLAQAKQLAASKEKEKHKAAAEQAAKAKEAKAARAAAAQNLKAPVESAKQRQEREELERKQAKERKEQAKKDREVSTTSQKVVSTPVNQKSLKKVVSAQQKKKPVAFWEDESFQPIFLLVGFLFVLAGLGYAFSL